ncbi:MAG: hypothetical protein R3300_11225 [Candidatus Promineifilaceae bacterium]|nr:hypothetical protein [Candidatus Promineifilaceae bacterium]
MDEELESLREKSTRASSVYDELEEDSQGQSFGDALRSLTPQQWFVLAFLLLLDVLAFALAMLIWTGQIAL